MYFDRFVGAFDLSMAIAHVLSACISVGSRMSVVISETRTRCYVMCDAVLLTSIYSASLVLVTTVRMRRENQDMDASP